jgi:hypothetical protein
MQFSAIETAVLKGSSLDAAAGSFQLSSSHPSAAFWRDFGAANAVLKRDDCRNT